MRYSLRRHEGSFASLRSNSALWWVVIFTVGSPLTFAASPGTAGSAALAAVASPSVDSTSSSKHVETPIAVTIDVLPGESDNLVDPATGGAVPVVIFGRADFDAASVDPATLTLAHAPAMKNDDGTPGVLQDIDHDGHMDLVVLVDGGRLRVGDRRGEAVLRARTFDGRAIRGADQVQPVRGLVAEAETLRATPAKEKLPPLEARFEVVDETAALPSSSGAAPASLAVAVLGTADLPARSLDPATVHLGAARITKGADGRIASYADVDRDGIEDLVVRIPKGALLAAHADASSSLRALTTDGRLVVGSLLRSSGDTQDPVAFHGGATDVDVVWKGDGPSGGGKEEGPSVDFTNTTFINIADNTTATPYPSTINVSGLTGVVSRVRVTLRDFSHTFLDDVDILLVGPTGQSVFLMSDVGGAGPGVSHITLTLDDRAFATLDNVAIPTTGSYVPNNSGVGDVLPAPAPTPSQAPLLSAFRGTDPNGPWRLYVFDDNTGDTGSIAQGWTLDLVLGTEFCSATPITIPAGAPGSTSGPAGPYPSDIAVSGLAGQVISKAAVTLKGYSHTFPADVDVMVQSPSGGAVMLMSDVGGNNDADNLTLVFDDDSPIDVPDVGPLSSRAYRLADFQPGESLPAPAPAAPYLTALAGLDQSDPNGTWHLWVADDDSGDFGAFAGGWCVTLTTIAPVPDCNSGTITIPAGAPGTTMGVASPYPSLITVAGAGGVIAKATVTLNRVNHTFPDDLDILLVAPGGQKIMLMSDSGGFSDLTNLALTFDDAGPLLPDSTAIASGTYHPTDNDPGESLPAPAPAAPYSTSLASLIGTDPNGLWRIYVSDDNNSDVGQITGGWCATLTLYLAPITRCNTAAISIPSGSPGTTMGPASLYPSQIQIASEYAQIHRLTVTLNGLTHTNPDDLDIVLQGPSNNVLLMSDCGGTPDVGGLTLTFDDDAAAGFLPDDGPLVSGTFRPTENIPGGDVLPAPAPAGPYSFSLSDYVGTNPNGNWRLFIYDDTLTGVGSLTQGWCINIWPAFPPAEVHNVRWRAGTKNTMEWDPTPNADFYRIYRGIPSNLPQLLVNGADDSCRHQQAGGFSGIVGPVPAAGSFYWYLVVGMSTTGEQGPAGTALIGTQTTAEIINAPPVPCP